MITLLFALACVGSPAPSVPAEPVLRPPNLLLVVWDTVRADHTTLYGYDRPTTPRTSAWAASQAVVHERAVSPGVWTLPSHASLFTGLPGRSHGVDARHTVLEEEFVTAAQALSSAGYETWAFVANPYLRRNTHLLRGFDTREHPWDARWLGPVREHLAAKQVPEDASSPMSPSWGGTRSQSRYLYKDAGPVAAQAFDAWLAQREAGTPWFAFVNLMEAHIPRMPSPAARQAVMTPSEQALALTVEQSMDRFHEHMAGIEPFEREELDALSAAYDATLRDLDVAFIALLSVLDRLDLADDTVVVLTSDHGEQLGEDGLLLHKYSVNQALTHVPLVVSWPGHLRAGRSDERVQVTDVIRDVAELAGLPLSRAFLAQSGSRPWRAVSRGVSEYRAVAPMSLDSLRARHPDADLGRFLATHEAIEVDQHKLTVSSTGVVRLFDLRTDPEEVRDLAPARPDRVAAMQALLDDWQAAAPQWRGDVAPVEAVDPELAEGLKGLGYVE